jgi:uncharacterized protein (DUF2252 family)
MKNKSSQPTPTNRQSTLLRRQNLKMARSAHAYVRGSTQKFYEWLASAPKGIPQGPPIWICGDCHVGNLGPIADTRGKVEIEIRDLDQTVIGNPAHDLIRLGLSLATAIRGSDLPGVTTALMLEQLSAGYTDALRSHKPKPSSRNAAKPVKLALKQALNRKWHHLAEERIEDVRPQIPLGPKFWALSKGEKREIARIFELKEVHSLITALHDRKHGDKIEVLDAAYWMKGCSSLGRLRYAVLLGVGKNFCLIDIKEATSAAAPGYKNSPIPRNHAERIVQGARALSPFLGERMVATKFDGKPVVLRELRPQDLKLELDQIDREEALAAARFLSGVVGRAHARQMTPATRKNWESTLKSGHSKKLDAPGWLWSSVVDLIATHEKAYLEHCRRYALTNATEL